jgi:hypothetical protein
MIDTLYDEYPLWCALSGYIVMNDLTAFLRGSDDWRVWLMRDERLLGGMFLSYDED